LQVAANYVFFATSFSFWMVRCWLHRAVRKVRFFFIFHDNLEGVYPLNSLEGEGALEGFQDGPASPVRLGTPHADPVA